MTTISMDTAAFGMAVRGRTIYYCTMNKGLMMLNLSDKSVSDIISSDMPGVFYIATSGDKLYYTNVNTHTVTCCDLHGTTQWQFKDTHVLQSAYGISIDNDGNVYVVDYNAKNVVVISPDGQRPLYLIVYIVLIFSYCPLVTSNRKAVLLSFTTNNLLVDLS
jgi:hypothetical protein